MMGFTKFKSLCPLRNQPVSMGIGTVTAPFLKKIHDIYCLKVDRDQIQEGTSLSLLLHTWSDEGEVGGRMTKAKRKNKWGQRK